MIINAKWPSACLACGRPIAAGERVSWIRGRRGVDHAACSAEGREVIQAVEASRAEVSDLVVPAPAGLSLLPYQRAGVAYMLARKGVILADEMGLGKTVQVAGLINADETIRTGLIICPKSLTINWQRELVKWLVRGQTVARVAAGYDSWTVADFVIASYEQAKNAKFRPQLEARSYDLVVVDEAHRVKNKTRAIPKAKRTVDADGNEGPKRTAVQRTEAVRALWARSTGRRLLLTGTPFESRPVELFPLLQMAAPEVWDRGGKGFFSYGRRYCNGHQKQVSRTRTVWDFTGSSNEAELQEKLRASCVVRRLKADVLKELPAKRRQIVELEMDSDRVRRHDEALAGGASFAEAAERLVGSPAAFTGASKARTLIGMAKAEAVAEFVDELLAGGSGPVLVGAWHREVINAIRDMLLAKDRRVTSLTGQHTAAHRQAAIDGFQAGHFDVLIGQIDAAGVGVTLTASSTVVMAELAWTPGQVSQFEDRAHRMGQRSSVNVYHLVVQNSLEAYIAKVVIAKQEVADAVLDTRPEPPPPAAAAAPAPDRTEKQRMLDAMGELLASLPGAAEQILSCLQLLAGNCDGARSLDGAGFSKIDRELGHSLAERTVLTPRQAALGLTLCRKYQKQLAGHGIEALLTIGKNDD